VCASHCAQLWRTILHRTDLIVFPLTLQTITTAPMMSIWGKGGSLDTAHWCIVCATQSNCCSTINFLSPEPCLQQSLWTHWLQDLGSHTAAWVWVVSQKDWRNQADGNALIQQCTNTALIQLGHKNQIDKINIRSVPVLLPTISIVDSACDLGVMIDSPKSLYLATPLAFNSPDRGIPLGHHRKIFRGCQWMAKVPNGMETLPKISSGWVGCTNVTDRRQKTDGRVTANSEQECEFTFAKNCT